MKKKSNRISLSPSNPATYPVTPPETKKKKKYPPTIVFDQRVLDYKIFKNPSMFHFFSWLARRAPNYSRVEVLDNESVVLGARQGLFKGIIWSALLGKSRITLWRYLKRLEKTKFVKRYLKHTFSIYTLTGKGLVYFEKKTGNNTRTEGVTPPATKERTQVNNHIILNKKDYAMIQTKCFNNFPCSGLEDGLPHDIYTWIVAGVHHVIRGDCKCARDFCRPHIKVLVKQLQGRAIKSPRAYVLKTLNKYFFRKGGDE